jgi:hypothetical protein
MSSDALPWLTIARASSTRFLIKAEASFSPFFEVSQVSSPTTGNIHKQIKEITYNIFCILKFLLGGIHFLIVSLEDE